MASVKSNIILNGINTVTSILFPVITFPYAARILLPEGIGIVNFLSAIVSYIVLITSVGIPLYAVKEIAKVREDKSLRDKTAIEIIALSILLCFAGYLLALILSLYVPEIKENIHLFWILSLSILFNSIGVNWFYQGIEDFKYITIRALIIRVISAICLFLFVKTTSDILIYGLITVGSTVGNGAINFLHLHSHLSLKNISYRYLNISKHIKPALQVFLLNLIISLYVQLNPIMLGFISGNESVGYFTAGTKISHVGLTLITSIGTVLLPRCSHLIETCDEIGFASVIRKSLSLTLLLSWPMMVGLMVLAKPIVILFSGEEFIPAISVLYWNAPVIIIISLTNLMGIQILYPKGKVSLVITSVAIGAISNTLFNFLLIPSYGALGATISTLVAELLVLISQIWFGRKYFPFNVKSAIFTKYAIGALVMGGFVYLSQTLVTSSIFKIIVGLIIGFTAYMIFLVLIKDKMLKEATALIFKKRY